VQAQPNSEFMHGKQESEPKVSLQKQVIRFEPVVPAEEANKTGMSSPPVTKQHEAVLKSDENDTTSYYSCDMCPAKFDNPEDLQRHRGESHKAPVNI
jgi:CRISPR/Cas system type I-B associated protein Csh2 (Cas7 group RAMP superfamily)